MKINSGCIFEVSIRLWFLKFCHIFSRQPYSSADVTVIWVSPCFGYPRTQIPSEMGIPGRDTQNTDSYTDRRLEEARSFCRSSPLFNTNVFIINIGAMS